jgi:hypothetical protein
MMALVRLALSAGAVIVIVGLTGSMNVAVNVIADAGVKVILGLFVEKVPLQLLKRQDGDGRAVME